jgi:hypothetical protein
MFDPVDPVDLASAVPRNKVNRIYYGDRFGSKKEYRWQCRWQCRHGTRGMSDEMRIA